MPCRSVYLLYALARASSLPRKRVVGALAASAKLTPANATQPINRSYLLWIACVTATLAVTMAVLLIRYQHIEWHSLAQLVMLLAAALSLAVRHRHQGQQAAEQLSPYLQNARTFHHSTSRFAASRSQGLHPLPAPAPTGQPVATDNIQRHLDMVVIKEICAAMNVTGYKVLLDQLLLDESRRLYRVCELLHAGALDELRHAAQGMQFGAACLGLTELAGVCKEIGSTDVDLNAAMRQDLCNRLKSAITKTHGLAVSMGLTGAPFPTLPTFDQTTTGSGSSMMPKRS